jgi:predicted ATP-dependent endonuclease of OLD family
MKLKSFRVREFQSVRDSGPVNIDDIACLVGKNESGKTALLKALYRLNPIVAADGNFNVTLDYPRMEVEDYRHDIESGKRAQAVPIEACFGLDSDEVYSIEELFGSNCLTKAELTLSKNYDNTRSFVLPVDTNKALQHLIDKADFSEVTRDALKSVKLDADSLLAVLQAQEQTEEVRRIITVLQAITKRHVSGYILDTFLHPREPKFLYFDEYYQLTGHENIEELIKRQNKQDNKQLHESDYPLLGLIRLARLTLPELLERFPFKSTIS